MQEKTHLQPKLSLPHVNCILTPAVECLYQQASCCFAILAFTVCSSHPAASDGVTNPCHHSLSQQTYIYLTLLHFVITTAIDTLLPSHHLVVLPQPCHGLVELKPQKVNLCLLCSQALVPYSTWETQGVTVMLSDTMVEWSSLTD
jgi:hypothetical protein